MAKPNVTCDDAAAIPEDRDQGASGRTFYAGSLYQLFCPCEPSELAILVTKVGWVEHFAIRSYVF